MHTVREVKGWGDPAGVLAGPGEDCGAPSGLDDDVSVGGAQSGAAHAGGGGERQRLRERTMGQRRAISAVACD